MSTICPPQSYLLSGHVVSLRAGYITSAWPVCPNIDVLVLSHSKSRWAAMKCNISLSAPLEWRCWSRQPL